MGLTGRKVLRVLSLVMASGFKVWVLSHQKAFHSNASTPHFFVSSYRLPILPRPSIVTSTIRIQASNRL